MTIVTYAIFFIGKGAIDHEWFDEKKRKKKGGGNKIERRDTCYPRSIYDLLSLAPFIFVPMGQFTGRKSSD